MAKVDHWQGAPGNTEEMGISVTSEFLDGRAGKGPSSCWRPCTHTQMGLCSVFLATPRIMWNPPPEIEPTPPAGEDS